MRCMWMIGAVAVSCLFAGCDGGTSTVTPEGAQAAVDATKRWQQEHSKPRGTIGASSSAADVLRKMQRRH